MTRVSYLFSILRPQGLYVEALGPCNTQPLAPGKEETEWTTSLHELNTLTFSETKALPAFGTPCKSRAELSKTTSVHCKQT